MEYDKCWCECKNPIKHVNEKKYVWNRNSCAYKIDEYSKNYAFMKNRINDSAITCNKFTETAENWVNKFYR